MNTCGVSNELLCAVLLLAVSSSLKPQSVPAPPRLAGSFVQLLDQHGNWSVSQWDRLFENFRELHLKELIVQWSVLDGSAYYPSRAFRSIANSPLEAVLERADRFGMNAVVGLSHDSTYWSNIQGESDAVTSYLRTVRSRALETATELKPIVSRHRSFRGWYIAQEIDDINWRLPESRAILIHHLATLTTDLRRLTPQAVIAVSAFSQGQASPAAWLRFWDDLFRQTPLNTVLFQDGVGVGKLELNEVPIYLEAVHEAAMKNGRDLQVVVELLRQVAGPPIDTSAFRAVPAPLERIRMQLEIAARYSTAGIIGFSVPEYMTPAGGPEAADLYSHYRNLPVR